MRSAYMKKKSKYATNSEDRIPLEALCWSTRVHVPYTPVLSPWPTPVPAHNSGRNSATNPDVQLFPILRREKIK